MSSIENTNENGSFKELTGCKCCLCQKSQMFEGEEPKLKTTRLCVLILKSLKSLKPENEYFSLKNDINAFITDHWQLLSKLKQFKSAHWRKALLDAFNHCSLIESGKEVCHNRGYYKLRDGTKKPKKNITKPKPVELQKEIKKEELTLTRQIPEIDYRNEIIVALGNLQNQLNHTNNILVNCVVPYVGNPWSGVSVVLAIETNNYHINILNEFKRPLLCAQYQ